MDILDDRHVGRPRGPRSFAGRLTRYGVYVAAVLFPAAMLAQLDGTFYWDWVNHLWLVAYFGEHFRSCHAFPIVVSDPDCAGLAYPVFYGSLLYPLLGLGAAVLNPNLVLRLSAVGAFGLQFFLALRTVRRVGGDRPLGAAVACLVVWSVYQLTNLYNRAAVTEFFALSFLTCSVCCLFCAVSAGAARSRVSDGLLTGFFFALAAGAHPITALLSLPLAALLLPLLVLFGCGRDVRRGLVAVAVGGALAGVVLLPWVYATVSLMPHLVVSGDGAGLIWFPDSLDWWVNRLYPLPLDVRPWAAAPVTVSTPYLDAQISIPLLFSAGWVIWRIQRDLAVRAKLVFLGVVAFPISYCVGATFLSVASDQANRLPSIVQMVQYPYRLVGHVNIGMLVALLTALAWVKRRSPDRPNLSATPAFLAFVLTLAGAGVMMKLEHAHVATTVPLPAPAYSAGKHRVFLPATPAPWVSTIPATFYGYRAYSTPRLFEPVTDAESRNLVRVPLAVGRGRTFGKLLPTSVVLPADGFVGTNVMSFPWVEFRVDGVTVPREQLRQFRYSPAKWPGEYIAVPVPAGAHVLEPRIIPDRIWTTLRWVSAIAFIGWSVVIGSLLGRKVWPERLTKRTAVGGERGSRVLAA